MARRTIDYGRLVEDMRHSRWMLERHRVNRREMVRQDAGARYSEEGTRETVPVNLIGLYKSVVGRSLISNNPRFLLSTFERSAKPVVRAMQSFANEEVERIKLKQVLKRVVLDALFSIGICKVALATPSDAAEFSWKLRAGRAFVENVDLDDFVCDPHARCFEEVSFIGHRYRVPLDTVKDSKLYSKARKNLTESRDEPYNFEGDERIHKIGQGYRQMQAEEFEPHVDLWEVYLPRHRQVVTLADDWLAGGAFMPSGGEPLREQKWIGPDEGPYHILGLGTVSGNLMPQGPLQCLFELHLATNETIRKIIRTVKRLKEVTLVQGGAMEDGSRAQQANDGDILRCDNPQNMVQLVLSGQHLQALNASLLQFKDLFNQLGGNLELMGGLSPQSKTAHQDEMLNQNSSRSLAEMQDETTEFVNQVGRALCWYWHHDPFLVQRSNYSVPGLPHVNIQTHVSPDQRKTIPFDQLKIQVDAYSLQHSTPESRMAALDKIVQGTYAPLAQLFMQQGLSLDLHAYMDKAGQYGNMPDLSELFTIRNPPQQGMGQGSQGPTPNTPTQNTRISMPGRTQQGNDRNMISALMGVNPGGNGATKNGAPH